jgi:Flp pilus assembly protein TadG
MMTALRAKLFGLAAAFRKDDGTASVEFVMLIPLLLTVFMSSIECGLLMLNSLMLEQSVDLTMRDLRLGHYTDPTAASLKQEICRRADIITDCDARIMIEMTRISTTTWNLPKTNTPCVDRTLDFQPVTTLEIGAANDLMLVRVCVIQDLLFPTSGLGFYLPQDSKGGYGLSAASAFVIEPI